MTACGIPGSLVSGGQGLASLRRRMVPQAEDAGRRASQPCLGDVPWPPAWGVSLVVPQLQLLSTAVLRFAGHGHEPDQLCSFLLQRAVRAFAQQNQPLGSALAADRNAHAAADSQLIC